MAQWIEVSVAVDGEGAEAVAEALRRYVHQGIAIEQRFPGERRISDRKTARRPKSLKVSLSNTRLLVDLLRFMIDGLVRPAQFQL